MNECDLTYKLPLYFTGVYIRHVQPLFIPFNMTLKEKFDLVPDFIKNLEYGDTLYIFTLNEIKEVYFDSMQFHGGYIELNLYYKIPPSPHFIGNKITHKFCIKYTKENKNFCFVEYIFDYNYIFTDLKEQDAILEDINKRMKENFKIYNGNN